MMTNRWKAIVWRHHFSLFVFWFSGNGSNKQMSNGIAPPPTLLFVPEVAFWFMPVSYLAGHSRWITFFLLGLKCYMCCNRSSSFPPLLFLFFLFLNFWWTCRRLVGRWDIIYYISANNFWFAEFLSFTLLLTARWRSDGLNPPLSPSRDISCNNNNIPTTTKPPNPSLALFYLYYNI